MDEHPMDHPLVDSDQWASDTATKDVPRRRWPVVLVSILIVIVAIGAAIYVAASHYQPLSQKLNGSYGAEVESNSGVLAETRVSGTTTNQETIWTEPSGSFRVEVAFSINNGQRFPITIDNVLPPAIPSGTSDVHVYFDSTPTKEGAYGLKGGPAFKPTVLASEGQLELVIHWNQQCVPTSADGSTQTYSELPVQFTFLRFHHTVNVPMQDLIIAPRATC